MGSFRFVREPSLFEGGPSSYPADLEQLARLMGQPHLCNAELPLATAIAHLEEHLTQQVFVLPSKQLAVKLHWQCMAGCGWVVAFSKILALCRAFYAFRVLSSYIRST